MGSSDTALDLGAVGDWCVNTFAGAPSVVERLPSRPRRTGGEYAERALAIRMSALVQQVPPYRAFRRIEELTENGWADAMARMYASHEQLVHPARGKAAELRPTPHGWVDVDPRRSGLELLFPPCPSPVYGSVGWVLTNLAARIWDYFANHAKIGVLGPTGAEAGLARLCLLLARFEAGMAPARGMTVEEIHGRITDRDTREVVDLVSILRGALAGLPDLIGVAEPVFVRGWAEGDLIAGDTLIAVSLGGPAEVARRLRHLVAQAWLDVEDLYRIRAVGVYLAACGEFVTWPIADLAGRLLSGADPDRARAEFLALIDQEVSVARPVAAVDAILRHRRDCTIVETTMPIPSLDDYPNLIDLDLYPDWDVPEPGWSVTPNGPICPEEYIAELALPVCAGLPDGWRIDYVADPYGEFAPHWECVKRRKVYRSPDADLDGLFLLHFLATIHERPEPPRKKSTRAAPSTPTVYGPEVWNSVADMEWTYWDLWYCVVCVADFGGTWADLDAKLYDNHHYKTNNEQMWSHLLDLRNRLAACGITAADLAGELAQDRKTMMKARSKVIERTGIRDKHRTPAMRDIPSTRLFDRLHFGNWGVYPVDPRPFYAQLAKAAPFDLENIYQHLPTLGNIEPLFGAIEEMEAEHADDTPVLLAVRRAAVTAGSLARHCCDPSYGDIDEATANVVARFSSTQWRATRIDPAAFWRDTIDVLAYLGDFGMFRDREHELITNLDAHRDRALLGPLIEEMCSAYTAERLDWHAKTLMRYWNTILVADRG